MKRQLRTEHLYAVVTTGESYEYEFDIGLEPNMEVNDKSHNRVKFKVILKVDI